MKLIMNNKIKFFKSALAATLIAATIQLPSFANACCDQPADDATAPHEFSTPPKYSFLEQGWLRSIDVAAKLRELDQRIVRDLEILKTYDYYSSDSGLDAFLALAAAKKDIADRLERQQISQENAQYALDVLTGARALDSELYLGTARTLSWTGFFVSGGGWFVNMMQSTDWPKGSALHSKFRAQARIFSRPALATFVLGLVFSHLDKYSDAHRPTQVFSDSSRREALMSSLESQRALIAELQKADDETLLKLEEIVKKFESEIRVSDEATDDSADSAGL